MDKKDKLCFNLSPNRNGGEALLFSTEVSDGYIVHEITLCSYANSATFTLEGDIITPAKLRKLADELEIFLAK